MKVLKVIVDELLQACCMCPLMGKDADLGYCISGQELESDYVARRPDWCVLSLGGLCKPGDPNYGLLCDEYGNDIESEE